MSQPSLQAFYAASASVAGALIGLLFVAISVARERLTAKDASQAHRIRAGAALTSFTNALVVSLFTLVNGQRSGIPAVVVAILGLMFVFGSVLSLREERHAARDVVFLVTLMVAFVAQLVFGIRVSSDARNGGSQRAVADLVVVFFLIGIARSWELIDGPSIGLIHELSALRKRRR